MAKLEKRFEFTYTYRKPVVRGTKMTSDKLNVVVSGVGYKNDLKSQLDQTACYDADIDSITYEGTEIIRTVEFFEQMDEVKSAAIIHVTELFEKEVQHA